jgi:hypothetical protein
MELEKFVETLRPMLKNPNALAMDSGVIYVYTNEQELVAFDLRVYVR